jgi:hypothetical protein
MDANNGGDDGGLIIFVVVLLLIIAASVIFTSGVLVWNNKEDSRSPLQQQQWNPTTQETRGTSNTQTPAQVDQQIEKGYAPEDAPSVLNIPDYLRGLFTPESIAAMGISGAIVKTLERIEISYRAKQAGISRMKLNALAQTGNRVMAQLGVKIGGDVAMRAGTAAARAGARAGARVTGKLATAAATGPAAPAVLAAEFVFGQITGLMDGLNLGGFKNLSSMGALNSLRDSYDRFQRQELGENQIPLVYGPLDTLSTEESDRDYFKRLADEMKKEPKKSSETDEAYIDRKGNEVWDQMCTARGGVLFNHPKNGNTYCSFKQTECTAPWPMEVGDTYYEWKDGVCQVRPSMMRKHCDNMGLGVSYDMNTGSCKLTEAYCGRYAGSAKLTNGDCTIPTGQKIAEMIFGTAFTRSIVNIFDFENNYKGCPPGTSEPYELTAVGLGPLSAQYLCGGSRCRDNEEMMIQTLGVDKNLGGMCYPKCRPGYKSNWGSDRTSAVAGMCYEDCPPGFDGTSELCTRLAQTRSSKQQTASCPPGTRATVEGPGGMCQSGSGDVMYEARKVCKDQGNIKYDGTSCIECYRDGRDRWVDGSCRHGRTIYAGRISRPQYICDRPGYKWDGGTLCVAEVRPLMDVGSCPPGYEKQGGMCYESCSVFGPEWKRTTTGLCQLGNITRERDSYSRANDGRAAYSVFPKERKAPFPSTSESDFKNSSVGKHWQKGINSLRDGNIEGLFDAAAGSAMTANPATLALGISDEMDMLYDEAKS